MKTDVKHLAKLAKLRLSSEEEAELIPQMEEIIRMVEHFPDMVDQTRILDPENAMLLREDAVKSSYPREDLLKNAPQVHEGCFVVPKVIE